MQRYGHVKEVGTFGEGQAVSLCCSSWAWRQNGEANWGAGIEKRHMSYCDIDI